MASSFYHAPKSRDYPQVLARIFNTGQAFVDLCIPNAFFVSKYRILLSHNRRIR